MDSVRLVPYKVTVAKDGPYIVTGGVPLSVQAVCVGEDGIPHGWRQGDSYPVRDRYALCRCGQSRSMPHCDGSHARVRFDGTETATDASFLDQSEHIYGPELELSDAEGYCMGAGFCRRDGGIWALTKNSSDPKAKQAAIEEACDCPSGRLVAREKEGDAIEPEFEPSIGVIEDCQGRKSGPLWVRGGIPVESSDGRIYEVRNRMTLCGCGRSSNKPFCDGSHNDE